MVGGLEAVADAIQHFEGWEPGSRSYRNRSPGNLRIPGMPADADGYSTFPDLPSGYSALVRDLWSKFTGRNTHKLGQNSSVLDLMAIYSPVADGNPTQKYADFVADWCSKALGKPLTASSKLSEIWQSADMRDVTAD